MSTNTSYPLTSKPSPLLPYTRLPLVLVASPVTLIPEPLLPAAILLETVAPE
nr:hypothetical protein [Methanobacterium paludis]